MKKFIPGLELCERFFFSAVKPIMKEKFPKIAYAVARLDYNSDVLGFDTPISMDYGWGPKLSMYILSCNNWGEREKHLSKAYLLFSQANNKLGLTHFIEPKISNFYDRPFLVLLAGRFANALYDQIKDPEVMTLPRDLGSINRICDNTDLLENIEACKKLRTLYE